MRFRQPDVLLRLTGFESGDEDFAARPPSSSALSRLSASAFWRRRWVSFFDACRSASGCRFEPDDDCWLLYADCWHDTV